MRDERALLGLLALHLVVAAPGAALLYALGLVRAHPVALMLAAGPAFLTGIVVVGLPLIVALVAGLSVGVPLAVAVASGLTVALALPARLRRWAEPRRPGAGDDQHVTPAEKAIAWVVLVAVSATFAIGATAFAHLPTFGDDAYIWSLKGIALYHHGSLVEELFRNPSFTYVHLDYPILQPLLEASFFHAIGGVDVRLWHVEIWLVCAAALWTMAWLLASLGHRRLWVLVLGVLAVSPIVMQNVTLGDADATMASMLGCGVLALGIGLDDGRRAHLILGALLVGGAANIKNEGLAFGTAVFAALVLVVVVGRLRARRLDLALSVGIWTACVLPWFLWVSGNEAAERATRSPWDALADPGGLADRLDFLWRGIEQVALQLVTGSSWGFLVPTFLVVAIVLLVIGRERHIVAFYLGAWLLSALAVAYTYWVTPIADIDAFEQRTGPRITLGVAFIAGSGLAHLLHIASMEGVVPQRAPASEAQRAEAAGSSAGDQSLAAG